MNAILWSSSSSAPGPSEAEERGDQEEEVGNPHCQARREFSLFGHVLGRDVEDPIRDDKPDTDDHPAGLGGATVRRRSQTDADQRKQDTCR